MGACDVLDLVLKVFFKIFKTNQKRHLLLLFMVKQDAQGSYTLDFAVLNVIKFSGNLHSGLLHAPMKVENLAAAGTANPGWNTLK